MNIRKLFLPLLAIAAAAGCSSRPAPEWVTRGSWAFPADRGRALYAVGMSSEHDPQLRNEMAKFSGRTELARRIKTHVSEVVEEAVRTRSDLFDSTQAEQVRLFSRVAEHTTDAVLGGSHKFDEWIDTGGKLGRKGTLYVLMIIAQDDAFYRAAIEETRKIANAQEKKLLKSDIETAMKGLEEEFRRSTLSTPTNQEEDD